MGARQTGRVSTFLYLFRSGTPITAFPLSRVFRSGWATWCAGLSVGLCRTGNRGSTPSAPVDTSFSWGQQSRSANNTDSNTGNPQPSFQIVSYWFCGCCQLCFSSVNPDVTGRLLADWRFRGVMRSPARPAACLFLPLSSLHDTKPCVPYMHTLLHVHVHRRQKGLLSPHGTHLRTE